MKQFGETAHKAQIFLLSLGVFVLLLGIIRGENSFMDYFALKESRQVLQETVRKLEEEVARLDMEIIKINESQSYALKVLRDKYHITEENENIMFFAE